MVRTPAAQPKSIMGISGLHNSVPFKQARFPGLEWRDYRITQGFDSAAALLHDGELVSAVAEERFTGEKATGAFPEHAIRFGCERAGISVDSLDVLAHGFSYEPLRAEFEHSELGRARFREVFARQVLLDKLTETFGGDWDDRLVQVPHHLAHAASTFYPSGFDSALVLVADGMGEQHSATVALGTDAGIEPIATVSELNSLGILYGVFTYYLGFAFGLDEYKIMGLAPYGDHRKHFAAMMDLIHLRPDGTFTIPILYRNETDLDRETYRGTLKAIEEIFGPARGPDDELTDHHRDIAAALQAALEATLLHTLRYFRKQTGAKNLCMAGGVALNCTANGVILRSRQFKRMFIQSAAGDDGTALGAALYVHHQREGAAPIAGIATPLNGPEYSDEQIAAALAGRTDCTATRFDDFAALAAELGRRLAAGQIGALFQGRLEYGPRALGNRSILGDPRHPRMRDIINAKVKKREGFRPFAPAVLDEYATTYFDIKDAEVDTYAWMLFITSVRPEFREGLPAVTHVDGSARVQTVSRERNERFWTVIDAFRQETGTPILLNTSFNVKGQPIVCTPAEGLDTFVTAGLDVLAIGNYLVEPVRAG
ncbi:carbamoyltransferase [Nocardia sp. 852002-20019_SCH5090214]|jgi:carbamoyltransferase|uniref:Carbamoyltransferase n=1 Tax=Nocardia nova TaxID=37330 RepID=A0A2S6A463_9NOCA|nr:MULTISPECIES: carbamoyltransferase C-terminal domain-containing protein [Nocardia]OBA44608.1 carbamoyltransferase [Nocardia sp. 852002-20019_SCH5090214]PPI94371.1 carbamoyltransferase [Nocardia nova]PPJ26769.1 carbamoyltransferase [Nocardia nova]